jgi:hypothetical protein
MSPPIVVTAIAIATQSIHASGVQNECATIDDVTDRAGRQREKKEGKRRSGLG